MVVLDINSRAACFSHFHLRHCEINFFEGRRRARIDAENGHRRVTKPRYRIIVKYIHGVFQRAIYGHRPIRFSTTASRAKSPEYERSTRRFLVKRENKYQPAMRIHIPEAWDTLAVEGIVWHRDCVCVIVSHGTESTRVRVATMIACDHTAPVSAHAFGGRWCWRA